MIGRALYSLLRLKTLSHQQLPLLDCIPRPPSMGGRGRAARRAGVVLAAFKRCRDIDPLPGGGAVHALHPLYRCSIKVPRAASTTGLPQLPSSFCQHLQHPSHPRTVTASSARPLPRTRVRRIPSYRSLTRTVAVPCGSVWRPVRHAAARARPPRGGPRRQCTVPGALCRAPSSEQPQFRASPRGGEPRHPQHAVYGVRARERGCALPGGSPAPCFLLYCSGISTTVVGLQPPPGRTGVKSGIHWRARAGCSRNGWMPARPLVKPPAVGTPRLRTMMGTVGVACHCDARKAYYC